MCSILNFQDTSLPLDNLIALGSKSKGNDSISRSEKDRKLSQTFDPVSIQKTLSSKKVSVNHQQVMLICSKIIRICKSSYFLRFNL